MNYDLLGFLSTLDRMVLSRMHDQEQPMHLALRFGAQTFCTNAVFIYLFKNLL